MAAARILIVEDDAILAAHLEHTLIQLGYEVTGLAATGADALASAHAEKPDAILMDIRLRGALIGIETAEKLHERLDTPVVYLTAYSDEVLVQQAAVTEAYAYLAKPVRPRELAASLEMALYKHGAERRLQHLNQVLRAVRGVNQLITRARDRGRLLEDACAILVRTRGYRLVAIVGFEDGQLRRLAAAGDGLAFLDLIGATGEPAQLLAMPGPQALRQQETIVCGDIISDERYAPWRAEAERYGFRCSAAVPMLAAGEALGYFSVFADRTNAFDDEEIDLLEELAGDLAFGLTSLAREAERQRAERQRETAVAALQASEERFRSMTEQMADVVFLTDLEGVITHVSRAARDVFGCAPNEMLGRRFTEFLPQQEIARAMGAFAADIESGCGSRSLELLMKRQDDSQFFGELSAARFVRDGIVGTLGVIRDITERKLAAQAIAQHEEELRMILRTAIEGYWLLDMQGSFVEVNDAYCSISGYSRDELLRMRIADVEAIETPQDVLAHIQYVTAHGGHRFESRHRCKDGNLVDVEMSTNYLDVGGGRMVCFCRDITKRKQMEAALGAKIAMLQTQNEIGREIATATEGQGLLDLVCRRAAELVHAPKAAIAVEDVRGQSQVVASFGLSDPDSASEEYIRQRGTGEDRPDTSATQTIAAFEDVPVSQPPLSAFRVHEGIRALARASLRAGSDVSGELLVFDTIQRTWSADELQTLSLLADQAAVAYEKARLDAELTLHASTLEQTVAERTAELRNAEARYRTLVEQTPGVTYTFALGREVRVLYISPQIETLTGFAPEIWMNQPGMWIRQLHPDDFQATMVALDRAQHGDGSFAAEYRMFAQDGRVIWIRDEGRLVRDEAQMATHVRGIMLDVTERKEAEVAMQRALAREKELGELKSRFLSMTSHEFRMPLMTILMSSDLLEHHAERLSEEKKAIHFGRIRSAVENMTHLLDDVLVFGRAEAGRHEFRPEHLDLVAFCQEMVEEMQQSVTSPHVLRFTSDVDSADACMDETLLRQILTNLLSNAIKYSPAGGDVQVMLSCCDGWATLRIQDEGIGIPEDDKARLFDAFHRAANVGTIPGTGLGLPIVKQSVELHGGTISIASKLNQGTTVVVKLPTRGDR